MPKEKEKLVRPFYSGGCMPEQKRGMQTLGNNRDIISGTIMIRKYLRLRIISARRRRVDPNSGRGTYRKAGLWQDLFILMKYINRWDIHRRRDHKRAVL